MSQILQYFSFLLAGTLTLASCKSDFTRSMANKPTAMGRINNVVILCDKSLAESEIGDIVTQYFEASYPVLTADEPIFDIRYMTVEELNANTLKRELRTFVLLADVSDTASTTTKMLRTDMGEEKFKRAATDTSYTSTIGQEKWAKEQIIIYIFGNGREKLAKAIAKNFPNIASRINQHDLKNLSATVYGIQSENKLLSEMVLQNFGINIKIPGLYQKALQQDNFLWLRMDNKEINQSLIIQKFPYKDKRQFDMDNIIKMRNEYGQKYIRTGSDDAYMSTNVIDLPTYEYTYINNGAFVKEVRGIWETVNDFMGGPFVSYLILNEPKGEVVFIDAFVFAPGKEKRDLVQQLDCIVKTTSLPVAPKK
ncbi:MAG: DUF4837 family protein [Saprospiraceae bacterium]